MAERLLSLSMASTIMETSGADGCRSKWFALYFGAVSSLKHSVHFLTSICLVALRNEKTPAATSRDDMLTVEEMHGGVWVAGAYQFRPSRLSNPRGCEHTERTAK